MQAVTYQKTANILNNIDDMIVRIEEAEMNVKIAQTLKQGNTALAKIHAMCSIDEIEKIMADTQEGIDKQQEMNDIISGAAKDLEIYIDEDELWNEFVGDEEKGLEEDLDKLPEVPKNELPEIPNDELPGIEVDQDVLNGAVQEAEREPVLA